ncbi:hypothetical protein ACLOJK_039538 [Asimina triloba]
MRDPSRQYVACLKDKMRTTWQDIRIYRSCMFMFFPSNLFVEIKMQVNTGREGGGLVGCGTLVGMPRDCGSHGGWAI